MDLYQTYQTVYKFIKAEPDYQYKLMVGTDSQAGQEEIMFVTAIVIYRVGRGGRFFYRKKSEKIRISMKQRIFFEVSKSLEIASKLTGFLADQEDLIEDFRVEIHVDVGEKGPTSAIIKEVTGMVVGSGYKALIKPESYVASTVADKFTK
ncbi:MAG: ribonuclease H-like YkuK family protein [Halanaerobiales bacterium]|nr:ribonuclease H-like YkuK family protein [Halanaerobiales bacterium]